MSVIYDMVSIYIYWSFCTEMQISLHEGYYVIYLDRLDTCKMGANNYVIIEHNYCYDNFGFVISFC